MSSQKLELAQTYEVPGARVVVLFGGNPSRRDQVVRFLGPRLGVTVVGTLSEEEGVKTIEALGDRVGAVVIGGRYDDSQRQRIRAFVARALPGVHVSEPGYTFAYDDDELLRDLRSSLRS